MQSNLRTTSIQFLKSKIDQVSEALHETYVFPPSNANWRMYIGV